MQANDEKIENEMRDLKESLKKLAREKDRILQEMKLKENECKDGE